MFKLKRAQCTNCLLCMQACTWAHESPLQSLAYSRIRIEDDWPEVKTIGVCVVLLLGFFVFAMPFPSQALDRLASDRDEVRSGTDAVLLA